MNPFTTDHPLNPESSRSDRVERPWLSCLCKTLSLALILTPFILERLYEYAISDIGPEPNPFPEPWRALFWGCAIAFVLGFFCVLPVVSVYQAISWRWRKQNAA